jgi:3-oxoacyl-[acyl-carrier protein] reductase
MILLTGVSGGIGKEILSHLLEIDAVVGTYNETLPKTLQNERVSYEKLNIKEPDSIKMFVEKWKPTLSKLTLIHAAVSNIDGLVANYKDSDWDSVMEVNLKGNFLLTKALLPCMIRERWGRIIHLSSIVGQEGRSGTIAYSASKTGLIGMSRVLAKEYARFNITSNILSLGYFEVGLIDSLKDNLKDNILNQIPSKKLGKKSNIVNAIEFLIKSEYVNGSVISINGGI